MKVYNITLGDGRTTEELMAGANYGYCHSQVLSDNFPARPFNGKTPRQIVLLTFVRPISSEEATAEAAKQGLERPYYEDGLYSGVEYPEVQLQAPVAFLHDPWLGNHGRRDAIRLWNNKGRRELGLEGSTTFVRPITGWHSSVPRRNWPDRRRTAVVESAELSGRLLDAKIGHAYNS